MRHSGKARKAGLKILSLSLAIALFLGVVGTFVSWAGDFNAGFLLWPLAVICVAFIIFTLNFFRDPDPRVPSGGNLVLSPAHGKVDVIETATEPRFIGGPCQRISIFLSVIDIHVQNAPVAGRIAYYKYSTGQFLSALTAESAVHNENLLLGFETTDPPGKKVGVRIIAGVLARRIVPWAQQGDEVARGDRLSLVQFGSRADVYLPPEAKIKVQLGDHVAG